MHLIIKLLLGIALGIALGCSDWLGVMRLLVSFKELFSSFLAFIIPLVLLFYLLAGIGSLGQNSTRLLGKTLLSAYTSTLLAGILAYLLGSWLLPMMLQQKISLAAAQNAPQAFFKLQLDAPLSINAALVLAFIFGLGISSGKAPTLAKGAEDGKNIIELLLAKVIVPLLPFYIGAIFAELSWSGQTFKIMQGFALVLVLALVTHWLWLALLYAAASRLSGRAYFSSIRHMLPAYLTAIGCMSSAATLPVSMRCARKIGIREGVVEFVMPLCATIHLCGSTITIVCCSMAVFALSHQGHMPSIQQYLPFIFMLGVVMIAAPGAPGGGVMSALGLLSGVLGFDADQIALMIALYIAQDGFGTATNVTGDGAIALLVDGKPEQATSASP